MAYKTFTVILIDYRDKTHSVIPKGYVPKATHTKERPLDTPTSTDLHRCAVRKSSEAGAPPTKPTKTKEKSK
jgi:hypothetical protein